MSTERLIVRRNLGEQLAIVVENSMVEWQKRRDRLLARASETKQGGRERSVREKRDLRQRAHSFAGWGERMGRELEEILAPAFSTENGEMVDFANSFGNFIINQLQGLQKEALEERIETITVSLIPLGKEEISSAFEFFKIRRGFATNPKEGKERLDGFLETKGDLFPENGILPPFLRSISERYPDPNGADRDRNR